MTSARLFWGEAMQQRLSVARDVAGELTATEEVVEDALAQAVRLMRRMIEARRELGLPVKPGEPAMSRVTTIVSFLGEAQRELVKARAELGAIREELGIPPVDPAVAEAALRQAS